MFTRLKNACLFQSSSTHSDLNKLTTSAKEEDNISKSVHDLSQADEVLSDNNKDSLSKSCSNISYAFKDESDIDISGLLDMRFGKLPKPDDVQGDEGNTE